MKAPPKEGTLYNRITVFGETFSIYYGYYDEKDRQGKYQEPMPIFPDFVKSPRYTAEGFPFVTHMQEVCEHYTGNIENDSCHGCKYFLHGEDLIGICKCNKNKK